MKCEVCGKEIEESRFSNAVLCSSECFKRHYWLERLNNQDSPTQVVIDGVVYQIGSESTYDMLKGYNGGLFLIHFFDGRKVKTTNLWHNGDIPDDLRDQFKDNAKFATIDEYTGHEEEYITYNVVK